MHFPVLLCKRETLVVVRRDFFERIGKLDEAASQLEVGVAKSDSSGLHWIFDCEGQLYELKSAGLSEKGILEWLGMRKRRQRFNIEPAQNLAAEQLLGRIAGLHDEIPEISNVADLRTILRRLPPQKILDRESLQAYFGE